jgi:hypothetical protein
LVGVIIICEYFIYEYNNEQQNNNRFTNWKKSI